MLQKLKNKKVLIFLSFIVLSILSLLYLLGNSQRSPISSTAPSPTPFVSAGPLKLLRTEPSSGTYETIWTTTALRFFFNQPISLETLQYKTTPDVSLIKSYGESQDILSLRPAKEWKPDTSYKITITKLQTSSGNSLDSPIEFEYKITIPENIFSD